ncbi:NUDIX hydrolase [Paenibacillus swuensis]|uniref:NUDIX hydrolase n=1 Tax=Paenibacillus swuensis TaxID=1178515 RepID=UPI000A48D616|nr:NUDIX domain-containing protein [Paenibacillus swuensis]
MPEEELFDIFDKEYNKIGIMPRREVHAKGHWHATFQCWIVSNKGHEGRISLLFQMRHPRKDTFPGLLDISCAGHLQAGETVREGQRELYEELGVNVSFEELHDCGVYAEEHPIAGGGMDREFCHLFIYKCDKPLEAYVMQAEEVTGIYWIDLKEFKEMMAEQRTSVQAAGIRVDSAGCIEEHTFAAEFTDFTPHGIGYYERLYTHVDNVFKNL